MRVSKMIGLGVTALLLAQTFSACTMFRTPYEQAKIQENGGVIKKESSAAGSDRGAGDEGGGDQKGGKKKQAGAKQATPGKAQTKSEKKVREQGKGRLLDIKPNVPNDTTPKMAYSKGLSSEVSKVEGVESSTVLLDRDHNAYVAIHSEGSNTASNEAPAKGSNSKLNVKTEGDIPDTVQKSVAKRLRGADPLVQTVYITSDPHHVQTFQRYAQQVSTGQLSQLNAEALTEHIEDIWR